MLTIVVYGCLFRIIIIILHTELLNSWPNNNGSRLDRIDFKSKETHKKNNSKMYHHFQQKTLKVVNHSFIYSFIHNNNNNIEV